MNEQKQGISFVARIWLERKTKGNPIWRGHIRHIQGKQETHFQDLGEMSRFMEQVARVPGPATTRLVGLEGVDVTGKPKN